MCEILDLAVVSEVVNREQFFTVFLSSKGNIFNSTACRVFDM